MGLSIEYRPASDTAFVRRDHTVPDLSWEEWSRLVRDIAPSAGGGVDWVELPWYWFLTLLRQLQFIQGRDQVQVTYVEDALNLVRDYVAEARRVREARRGLAPEVIGEAELRLRLGARGWDFGKRELKEFQVRDLLHMLALSNGANFSVPGSGKTTVALALHLAATPPDANLLVVSPKNAFPAWDQVLEECLAEPFERFVRIGVTNGSRGVRDELAQSPKRAIVSYGQLVRARLDLSDFVSHRSVHLVLDESHRIKGGDDSLTGNAALLMSHLAIRRDILSGTPMPNSVADLGPQFDYLWPAQGLSQEIRTASSARAAIGPLYVRTKKSELNIPAVTPEYRQVAMSDVQRLLYGLLRDDVLRARRGLSARQMPLGANASVMRLLQAAVDPQAAANAIYANKELSDNRRDDFQEVCRLVMEETVSPRMVAVEEHARELVSEGRKTVIWAPFRHTIETLQWRLADLGAEMIHGSVEAGDESDDSTREGIVRRFHEDETCRIIVANPAAGGEGISLHRVCHDAIYVGRTYNAAHFLQSRDRIHRLGLKPTDVTRITVYEALTPKRLGSIDLSIRNRLNAKVAAMDDVFDDEDLRAIPLESSQADPALDDGFTLDDLDDLFARLGGHESDV